MGIETALIIGGLSAAGALGGSAIASSAAGKAADTQAGAYSPHYAGRRRLRERARRRRPSLTSAWGGVVAPGRKKPTQEGFRA